jgi:hypothetical protein
LLNAASVEDANETLKSVFEERVSLYESNGDLDRAHEVWQKTQDVRKVLWKCLFVENDQVVLPSLNLATAKIVYCRTDCHKKELRKMGFYKDRIKMLSRKPHHHQY